jgi:hypothetical protein
LAAVDQVEEGMIVYKVVQAGKEPGEYYSAIAKHDAKVIYRPNEWAETPGWLAACGFYLVAFDNLAFALRFKEQITVGITSPIYYVVESEAELPSDSGNEFRLTPESFHMASVVKALPSGWEHPFNRCQWPPGTIYCQRIKLGEKGLYDA